MKALPKRKGNAAILALVAENQVASMKALPKRKGNAGGISLTRLHGPASMKALPKRKGNGHTGGVITSHSGGASMKVYTSGAEQAVQRSS